MKAVITNVGFASLLGARNDSVHFPQLYYVPGSNLNNHEICVNCEFDSYFSRLYRFVGKPHSSPRAKDSTSTTNKNLQLAANITSWLNLINTNCVMSFQIQILLASVQFVQVDFQEWVIREYFLKTR